MNRFAMRLATAGLLAIFACSPGSTTVTADGSNYLGPGQSFNLTGTLQGIVADAVTGKRVGGDLKLYLIQGSSIRGPSRLITSGTDPLQGEYAFTGVPVALASSNAVWKVVAIATGYERFESEFTFEANSADESEDFPPNYIDSVFNKIGNIFLFPTGTVAPDYTFNVTFNGKAVPGATVELDPLPASNSPKFTTTGGGDTLFANTGYVQSITATTDANGNATIAGSGLALGGAYKYSVLPVVFTDPTGGGKVQLQLFSGSTIVVGFATTGSVNNDVVQMIQLSDAVGDTGVVPLYLASMSNPPPNDQLFADGKLTLVFSNPVSLVNPNCFDAVLNPGAKADLSAAGTGVLSTTQPVNATLSADGLTLTLAPNYSTAPAATDRGVAITYTGGPPSGSTTCGTGAFASGGKVVAKDYPALSFDVFSIATAKTGTTAGVTDTGLVHITGP